MSASQAVTRDGAVQVQLGPVSESCIHHGCQWQGYCIEDCSSQGL